MTAYVLVAAGTGFGFANSATMFRMYAWNFTLSFFSLGAWSVWNTWLGENHTTDTRGAGVAWDISAQCIANAVAPIVIGTMLATTSLVQTVTLFPPTLRSPLLLRHSFRKLKEKVY